MSTLKHLAALDHDNYSVNETEFEAILHDIIQESKAKFEKEIKKEKEDLTVIESELFEKFERIKLKLIQLEKSEVDGSTKSHIASKITFEVNVRVESEEKQNDDNITEPSFSRGSNSEPIETFAVAQEIVKQDIDKVEDSGEAEAVCDEGEGDVAENVEEQLEQLEREFKEKEASFFQMSDEDRVKNV